MFTNLAESDDKPHRIIFGLAVIEPLTLSLKGFAEAKAGDRYKTVRKRLKSAIQPHLEAMGDRPRYPLGVDAIAKRLVYAEAIELARGKPTDTARFVRWISGETVTPQAALKMRKKMAVELRLIGRAWTQRRSS